MTETLISHLARIRSLKVITRTSVMHYKHADRRLFWENPQCGARDWAPFRPRNRQEEWVAAQIKRANAEIWTLLVGGVRRTLEGPVVVGSDAPQKLNESRRQLLPRIAMTPIREDALKNWQVVVKPVRASRESCLGRHADRGKAEPGPPLIKVLKLGDPLGFLVYLRRQP